MTLRHNRVKYIATVLLKEGFSDVTLELQLQHITGKVVDEPTANKLDDARVDISVTGFLQLVSLHFLM